MITLDIEDLKDEPIKNESIWGELEFGYLYFIKEKKDLPIQEMKVRNITQKMVEVRIATPNSKIGRYNDVWKDRNDEIYKIVDKKEMGEP